MKDQIVAEAAKEIMVHAMNHSKVLLNEFTVTDIIKAAIERALNNQGDDYANIDAARNRILDLEAELAQLRATRAGVQLGPTLRL